MNPFRLLLRLLLAGLCLGIVEDTGGGDAGALVDDVDPPDVADQPTGDATPSAADNAPKTMLDAISRSLDGAQKVVEPLAGMARDDKGRFAGKADPVQPVVPAKPGAQPAQAAPPAQKPKAVDLTAMPDGLTPKSQERFQALANNNRELTTQVEQLRVQNDYVKEVFRENAVRPEQFDQAMQVCGALNRGDYASALQVLDEQRRLISLAMGKPLPGADALSEHPDLRQAVDSMQMTESHAMELARLRMTQQAQAQRAEQQQGAMQRDNDERKAVQAGTKAIDELCTRLSATDIDWPSIEDKLLPEVANLLRGVPPSQWAATIEAQYRMIKQFVGSRPSQAAAGGNPLRPTGQASPSAAPKTAYEAMFGSPDPRA